MSDRFIVASEIRFNIRDYKRFGIYYYEKQKLPVEVWDISGLVDPEKNKGYEPPDLMGYASLHVFKKWQDLKKAIAGLERGDSILCLVSPNRQRRRFYRFLRNSEAKKVGFAFNLLEFGRLAFKPYVKKAGLFNRLKKMTFWKLKERLISYIPIRFLGMCTLDYVYTNQTHTRGHPLSGPNTKIIVGHQWDYDIYLDIKDNPKVEKKIAVFMDQYLPFHPDRIGKGKRRFVDPEKYFLCMNRFFEIVEKQLGLEVVIAAHPRAYEQELSKWFGGRRCIRGKTGALVRDADYIMAHFSASLNFAVLFNKPVTFLYLDDFRTDILAKVATEHLAGELGKKPIHIDQSYNVDWEAELKVDQIRYDTFKHTYIKNAGPEQCIGEIILRALRNSNDRQG